jgi:pimeloyl-ACP methyl ester carboxylesterase
MAVAKHMIETVSTATDKVLRLRDGRLLRYAEYGDPDGTPLFYFHGSPGSRFEGWFVDEAARRRGIRVIAFDRPGFGSDFKPGRTIGDWPDDVVQAADAFGFDRFAILGLSFGGPHALACALRIPERLTSVAIVSSVGPFQAPGATDGMGACRFACSWARSAASQGPPAWPCG